MDHNDQPATHRLGDTVTHTGTIGGMLMPIGIVTRTAKLNSLLSVMTYGVTFPQGYFLVPQEELIASTRGAGTQTNPPSG